MINQERRNEKAHRRHNQFMQDGKALDSLQTIATEELNKLPHEIKDKDESESTCHSERRSRWETNEARMSTCSRKTRNQRPVYREKLTRTLNRQQEEFKSISPDNSYSDSNQLSNENKYIEQNISINEMFNIGDLKNEEYMIKIIKEKFTQIIKDMKYKYLSNPYRSIIDNFLHLKEKYSNNEKQLDLIITDFFLRKIKDINEIFYQLEQCYNSTIKSPDFIEKFIGPISKIFEKKNVNNINFFENVLKEEFFIIILNDKFIKEIIQEIENRDLKNLEKIKNLIKSIKEESCIRHSNNCINNQNSKQIDKNLNLKAEMVVTTTVQNSTGGNFTRTSINAKKGREGKIVSPANYSVKTNLTVSSQNENEYKNINDLVEYINSENGKQKKKNKKKNISKKKKQIGKKPTKILKNNQDSKITSSKKVGAVMETDSEIEEFKRKIKNQSINSNMVEKIRPQFSDDWLKLLKSSLEC